MNHQKFTFAAALLVAVSAPSVAEARTQLRAVGSSTVYPFAKAVAERVARANPRLGTPIIEFDRNGCRHEAVLRRRRRALPRVSNASRRMKASEAKIATLTGSTDHRNPGRHRRAGCRDREIERAQRAYPTGHLPGDREDAIRQGEQGQDLEGRQRQTACDPHPRLRPAPTSGTRDSLNELDPEPPV